MLFDTGPKESVENLYDREKELKQLRDSLNNKETLIVVYGPRRAGKTSLIHAFLNSRNFPFILIDVKEIYFEHASVPLSIMVEAIGEEFIKFTEKLGIDTSALELGRRNRASLTDLLKSINEWCREKKLLFVIALDEAQYLKYGGRVRYDGILAWSVDNLTNIAYILTGSEVGMLKEFLRYEDADAPLYGRFRSEIYLNRFDRGKSEKFLKSGFKEAGKAIKNDELNDAVDKIDGITGWLTYYGHYRVVDNLKHKEAVGRVFEEGSGLSIKEIERAISHSRKRYVLTLRAIVTGVNKWAEIKSYVAAKSGNISDTVLNSLLQSLVKFGMVEKDADGTYTITDPIVAYAVKKLKP